MRRSELIYRCVAAGVGCVGAVVIAIFGPPVLAVLLVVYAAIQCAQVVYWS